MTEPGVVEGEQVRILICFDCATTEVMSDYPPESNPQGDIVLHSIDEKHGGATDYPHYRVLHRVPKRAFDDDAARKDIIEKSWAGREGRTGLPPEVYDVKDTLKEDAAQCFQAHRRPTPTCIDYRDSSKRLRSPSQDDRNKLAQHLPRAFRGDRDAIKHGAPVMYLCQYCPVQVMVEHAQRKSRGEA